MSWLIDLLKVYGGDARFAACYGVVLYTDAHAHVKKVLSDVTYWNSLDFVSGEDWLVFAVRSAQGTSEHPPTSRLASRLGMGMLVEVWKEPRENLDLLEDFGLPDSSSFPALLVFTRDEDGDFVRTLLPIDETTIESTYNTIRRNLQLVSDTIAQVDAENRRNVQGLNNALDVSLSTFLTWEKVKRVFRFWQVINSVRP